MSNLPAILAVIRDSFSEDYLDVLHEAPESMSPRDMAGLLPELLEKAEHVALWGMSLTTFPDLHRLLYAESRKGHGIKSRALIAHPQALGKAWIEPDHPHDGIERRRGRILWAARDYREVGAEVKLLRVDEVPLTSGVAIDSNWMAVIPYTYSFSSRPSRRFPLELKTTLEKEREMTIFQSAQVKDFLLRQFDRLFDREQ